MTEALLLFVELAFFAMLLFAIRRSSMRGQDRDLGFFAYHETLTTVQPATKKKNKGSRDA